ncbi:hypothetical protein [Myxacorys almedinensis]|uniref:Uncharacterized protein n=1 Tax=Myxacorys almedinensis A TaxID=2690445 RepID=A0A8J8CK99_9CYAN|nr:hypothetical protein [Myxacorys almedinensis]NDJ16430.1 hypothetical protein [Myxacorys almedinensis A]
MSLLLPGHQPVRHRRYWLERAIAVLAAINLALVFFDLSYLYARSFYLQVSPQLVQKYDFVKGIRPYPETQAYLDQVAALESHVVQFGLQSADVETALTKLRREARSQGLSQENGFAGDSRSDAIATINQTLKARTGATSDREAYDRFWSQPYLTQTGWQAAIAFWNTQIRPLLAANYYRQVDRFGHFVDYFWLIDLPFILLFAVDTLSRIRAIGQRQPELSWLEASLRRWYDFFLLLPFWRWLRVLPVSVRLYQADLLDLEPLRAEAQHDFVIGFAAELTEMVGVQAIDQLQASIRRGDIMRWLLYPETRGDYVQVNGQNEVSAIAARLVNIGVKNVLPQVQPDIQALVHHSVVTTVKQLPGYQQLQQLPGISYLPQQIADNLAKALSHIAYANLVQTLEDPVAAEITTRLSRNVRDALEQELQKKHNTREIESLLIDMLEEIKINYVREIGEIGIEQLAIETEQLHRKVRTSNQ